MPLDGICCGMQLFIKSNRTKAKESPTEERTKKETESFLKWSLIDKQKAHIYEASPGGRRFSAAGWAIPGWSPASGRRHTDAAPGRLGTDTTRYVKTEERKRLRVAVVRESHRMPAWCRGPCGSEPSGWRWSEPCCPRRSACSFSPAATRGGSKGRGLGRSSSKMTFWICWAQNFMIISLEKNSWKSNNDCHNKIKTANPLTRKAEISRCLVSNPPLCFNQWVI